MLMGSGKKLVARIGCYELSFPSSLCICLKNSCYNLGVTKNIISFYTLFLMVMILDLTMVIFLFFVLRCLILMLFQIMSSRKKDTSL